MLRDLAGWKVDASLKLRKTLQQQLKGKNRVVFPVKSRGPEASSPETLSAATAECGALEMCQPEMARKAGAEKKLAAILRKAGADMDLKLGQTWTERDGATPRLAVCEDHEAVGVAAVEGSSSVDPGLLRDLAGWKVDSSLKLGEQGGNSAASDGSGDATPCKVTPVILHGVVSPDGGAAVVALAPASNLQYEVGVDEGGKRVGSASNLYTPIAAHAASRRASGGGAARGELFKFQKGGTFETFAQCPTLEELHGLCATSGVLEGCSLELVVLALQVTLPTGPPLSAKKRSHPHSGSTCMYPTLTRRWIFFFINLKPLKK